MARKKLVRSSTDRMISGVLGGIAEYFGVDSTVVRCIFLFLCWSGFPVFAYIVLIIIIPEGDRNYKGRNKQNIYYENRHRKQKRKQAHPVDEDEEWSDF